MELELATSEDIVKELMKRQMRFVFVGIEETNTHRERSVCVAGKAADSHEAVELFGLGQEAFQRIDEETDGGEVGGPF